MAMPKEGYFEVRFESIGGLGAHAGAFVLGSAAVYKMGYNAVAFSSYGSEKKGTPVRSFIRLSAGDYPIRNGAPVEQPDVVVFFHAALLTMPVTIAGIKADAVLIYNAPKDAPLPPLLEKLPKTVRVFRLDALQIAIDEKSRPNAVLLGALSSIVPFLEKKALLDTLTEEFAGKHPEAVASNTRAFDRGGKEYEELKGIGKAAATDLPIVRSAPVWGWKTAPLGGMLPTPGNMAWNNMATSRTGFMPVFKKDDCIHCGVCDLVCPDMCIVWENEGAGPKPKKTRLVGIDYRYCKGCMRCVESCPTGAMVKEPETPGLGDKLRVKLFPEFVK